MKYYFRTKIKTVIPIVDGKPVPGAREFVLPEEVELDLDQETLNVLATPGALEVKLKSGQVLDLCYGYASIPGEILTRDIEWLNRSLVYGE